MSTWMLTGRLVDCRSVMDRCRSRTALWLLLHLLLTASAAPQFTNLRVLKSGNVQGRSSAVKRVSMSQLLQRLEHTQLAKNLISVAPVKESVIKRVAMINSPATFKPLFTRFAALNKTLPTTSRYVPDQLADTPTTQAPPTTPTSAAPPTRATPSKPTLKSKFYVKKTAARPSAVTKSTTTSAPPTKSKMATTAPAASTEAPPTKGKTAPIKLKNGDLLVSKSELKNLPNSPIYYIKLPHSGYSFVGGSAAKASGLSSAFPHVQLPIDFSSNGKPSAIYLANKRPPSTTSTTSTTLATTRAEDEASSTTAKTPLTESRVIYIKGNFNGKPNHVYWEKAHYRPPTYWDFLHHLYPKLRKAQLIR